MSELNPESKELFRMARQGRKALDEDRVRVRTKLASSLGVGAFAASVAPPKVAAAPMNGAKSALLGGKAAALFLKLVLPIALAVVCGVAVLVHRTNRAPVVERAHESEPPKDLALPKAIDPADLPSVTLSVEDLPPVRSGEPASRAKTRVEHGETASGALSARQVPDEKPEAPNDARARLDEEVSLLRQIHEALDSKNAAEAKRLALDHRRHFPQGTLVEEREGAILIASCALGEKPSIDEFVARYPRSPLLPRVQAACGAK